MNVSQIALCMLVILVDKISVLSGFSLSTNGTNVSQMTLWVFVILVYKICVISGS